jgi:Ca2+-binding RTX toxin-like protein
VVQNQLKLKDNVSFDYETATTSNVTVTATDGGGLAVSQNVTILVDNVNEMPIRWLGTNGADSYSAKDGNDYLYGKDGADRLFGGSGDDNLDGGVGNDVLNGETGNDNLNGGLDDDQIDGGLGNNTLTGGLGHDVFLLTALPDNTITDDIIDDTGMGDDILDDNVGSDIFTPATPTNMITDFNPSDDTIQLENAVFTALTTLGTLAADLFIAGDNLTTAVDANDYLIYNSKTGELYYDADANGVGKAVVIALLATPHPVLTAADFIVA